MIRKNIPNVITIINGLAGIVAILLNDPFVSPIIILAAAIIDFADGFLARKLNVVSKIGKELDSFSDLISFGVAPAYLYFHHILTGGILSIIVVSLLPVAAMIRLAKFNVKKKEQFNFSGLPVPASGLLMTFLVFENGIYWEIPSWCYYTIPILLSFFMISSLTMLSLKYLNQKRKTELIIWCIIGIIGLIGVIFFELSGIVILISGYIVFSLLFSVVNRFNQS